VRPSLASRVFRCRVCAQVHGKNGAHADARDERKICQGASREFSPAPFDVAWRQRAGVLEALILFIDNPSRPLKTQLAELPLGIDGQAPVSIIVRSVDPDSRISSDRRSWLSVGPRHRALLRAFRKPRVKEGEDDGGFSEKDNDGDLGATANVIDPYPGLHVHG
jgi:hypothetical protein